MIDVLLFLVLGGLMVWAVAFVAEDYLEPLALFTYLAIPAFFIRPALILFGFDEPILPHLLSDPEGEARRGLLLFTAGYATYTLAYASRGLLKRFFCGVLDAAIPGGRISMARLRFGVAIALLASTGVIVMAVMEVGSVAGTVVAARSGLFDGRYVLAKTPLVTGLVAMLLVVFSLRRRRGRFPAMVAFLYALFLIAILGDRSGIIYPLLALAVCYHFAVRRFSPVRFGTVVLACVVLLVSLGEIRGALRQGREIEASLSALGLTEAEAGFGRRITRGMNLQSFDHWLVVLEHKDRGNYRWGEDFFLGTVGVVPRAIWAGKPPQINAGGWFSAEFTGKEAGQPFTAVGVWWLNFGLAGVIVGMGLSGLLFGTLWSLTKRRDFDPPMVILVVVTFFNITGLGVLTPTLPVQFVFWGIPFLALYAFIGVECRRTSARRGASERGRLSLVAGTPTS